MPNGSRGVTLTILAMLLALMALSNFGKPFAHNPGVGFVFLGTRLSGVANMVVAPIFGMILTVYVYGIFAMRKFALPLGIFYAAYVIVNMPLFILRYHGTAVMQEHSWAYLVPYPLCASPTRRRPLMRSIRGWRFASVTCIDRLTVCSNTCARTKSSR